MGGSLMHALTLPRLRLERAAMLRGVAAGTLWGVTVAAALLGLSFYQCGSICLGQIVDTTALSMLAGIVAIGPVAAFRREAAASPQ
jgi:hypothetical protein